MERWRRTSHPLQLPWLINGNEQYGVRNATRALLCAVRDLGVSSPIIALSDGEFTQECADLKFPVTNLRCDRTDAYTGSVAQKALQFMARRRQEIAARRAVTAALGAVEADALNFCRPTLIGIAGPAAHANGLRTFWHVPNPVSSRYPGNINRRMYQKWCERFGIIPLANSAYTASTLGYAPVRPRVLYLAVDPQRFDPAAVTPVTRSELGIPPSAIVIGIVARLDPTKGQAMVVEAMLPLVADGNDLHLVVVGGPTSGAYYDRIVSMLDDAQQRSRVHFIGPVNDVERFYPLFDFSINSTVEAEAFGLSIIESMMSGCPSLVHAFGGPAETVLDGVTGWHYHGSDVRSISNALMRALGDRTRWPAMGAAARKRALENFTLEIQARNYLNTVHDVLYDRRRIPRV